MKQEIIKLNTVNRNNRLYCNITGDNIITKINDKPPVFGTLGFQSSFDLDYNDVGFVVSNATREDNSIVTDIKILSTPKGQILTQLLEDDSVVFRTKGLAVLEERDDGVMVATKYQLLSVAAIPKEQDSFKETV